MPHLRENRTAGYCMSDLITFSRLVFFDMKHSQTERNSRDEATDRRRLRRDRKPDGYPANTVTIRDGAIRDDSRDSQRRFATARRALSNSATCTIYINLSLNKSDLDCLFPGGTRETRLHGPYLHHIGGVTRTHSRYALEIVDRVSRTPWNPCTVENP